MRKTVVLLAVLCLGLVFALPAAAATAPGELTLDLFVTEATTCHQDTAAQAPAAAAVTGEQPLELLFDNGTAAFGEQCGSVVCSKRTYCCNASCSWCVPEGMSCIQIAC